MGHMARSVLEGVSFGLNDSLTLMKRLGINPSNVVLTGGGTRSSLWKQMLADVFESTCTLVNAQEGAAYGAAMLAAVGVKIKNSVEEVSREWIKETERILPNKKIETYRKLYSQYVQLYPFLKDHFYSMSKLF